jgi:hypothetical protein
VTVRREVRKLMKAVKDVTKRAKRQDAAGEEKHALLASNESHTDAATQAPHASVQEAVM